MASQNIESIISKNRKFELRQDCLAFKLHEKAALPTETLDLMVDPFAISSKLFPGAGAIKANEFGNVSSKDQVKK